ncbi:MAG: histidinol dehydrogenase [Fimbriimonas sp.]|nr:histidinol dehydrogenase [Fimbriimonas sp.]
MGLCRFVDARTEDPFALLAARQVGRDAQIEKVVAEIIEDVRVRGDAALLDSARRYDAPNLASIEVPPSDIDSAALPAHFENAIRFAANRIEQFHTLQLSHFTEGLVPEAGSFGWEHAGLGQRVMPLDRVGVYVPGGKATYPSSVLMNVIPGRVAGVGSAFVTTPARADGSLAPSVLFALKTAGVDRAYRVGGAAAIAALAFGTESVPRVDKIVGPGNRFVNEAKRQLWGRVGLDGYAGPSEVCVLVDETANPKWAAADLLTQIEHSDDNSAFLVSTCEETLRRVLDCVEIQLAGAQAEATMRNALADQSMAILAKDVSHAVDIVNAIAPEHLTISTANPEAVLGKVKNAGAVLLGDYTPESAGDFVLGPSHTLPTSGAARFGSPVNVLDFLKIQSVSQISFDDLAGLIPTIEAFGQMEGFPTHARGATIRQE